MTDSPDFPEDFNLQGTSSSYGDVKTPFDSKELISPLPSFGTFIPAAAKTIPPHSFSLKPVGGEMGPKSINTIAKREEILKNKEERITELPSLLHFLGELKGRIETLIRSADFEEFKAKTDQDNSLYFLRAVQELEDAVIGEYNNEDPTIPINDFIKDADGKIAELTEELEELEVFLKSQRESVKKLQIEKEERLQKLQKHIVAFAKLDGRVEELFNKKGVSSDELEKFYTLRDTLVWIKNPIENTMSDQETLDTLAVMDDIVSGLENVIEDKESKELEALRTQLADALAATATPRAPTEAPRPRREINNSIPTTIREVGINTWELDENNNKNWKKIEAGTPIEKIIKTLQDYGDFIEYIKREKLGEEYYLQVALLKDEVLDALEALDLSLADTKAQQLGPACRDAQKKAKEEVSKFEKTESPKSPELFMDIYSGWPSDIIEPTKGKNGVLVSSWKLRTDSGFVDLTNGPLWASLQSNFNEEFNTYIQFLKQGDKKRKLVECVDLINEKNAIRQALLEQDTAKAGALITIFRQSLDETLRLWDEKLKVEVVEREKSKKIEEEQKKLKVMFDHDVVLLEETKKKLVDTIVPFITSDLTRRMLEKRLAELLEIKERIISKSVLEIESIEYFHTALANYILDLTKKETVLTHLPNTFGGRGGKRLSATPKDPTIDPKDSDVSSVGKADPLTFTQWETNRASEENDKEAEKKIAKSETYHELLATHTARIHSDPTGYIKLYAKKSWLKGDPNKEVSIQVIDEYKKEIEADRDELTRQCTHLKDLLVEEPTPLGESLWRLRKEQVDALEQEISNLNKWILTIENIPTNTSRRLGMQKSPSKTSTLDATKATYSPMRNKEKRKFNWRLYGKTSTPKEVQDVAARMQATHPYSPADNVGMDHALGRAKPTTYETAYMPEPSTEVEKERKISAVRKLFTTLESKLPKKDWRVWAVAATSAMVLAGAAQLAWNKYGHKETHAIPEMNKTAGSTVSWKHTLVDKDTLKIQSAISHNDSKEERSLNSTVLFLHDLIGDEKKGGKDLSELFKKYASSVSFDPSTSRMKDIGLWECDLLLNQPEAIYGLNNDERKEVCRIINHMRVIVQAAEPPAPKGGAMIQNKHYAVSPHETISDLFEAARRAAVEANQREEKESKK